MATHILELPLKAEPWQIHKLDKRLDAARQVYNAVLGESLRRLWAMRRDPGWGVALGLGKGKARSTAFKDLRTVHGFSEYSLHAWTTPLRQSWIGDHLDSMTLQKLATRAFGAVREHSVGQRGKPRFKGKGRLRSVEGKSNKTGIRWKQTEDKPSGTIHWKGLILPTIIDPIDPVIAHGLGCRVKYVRLVRRNLRGRALYCAQLVLDGAPFQKPHRPIGTGTVGVDIGPSTIAAVGPEGAFLARFCDGLMSKAVEVGQLRRKLDRQRRSNNPTNYNPNGAVKPGPKRWHHSSRQRKTEARLAELGRQTAAHRKSLHGAMVHCLLALGDTIKLEKLSYKAFQKMWGRSVRDRAPGMFVELLKRKAESAGAKVLDINTYTTALSQSCHCGAKKKKSLSQRWHVCSSCGTEAQRDLYSAFLARFVEPDCAGIDRLMAGRATLAWPSADRLLQTAMSDIQAAKRAGAQVPASFGASKGPRRQSRSSAKPNPKQVQAHGLPPLLAWLHGKALQVGKGTPWL